MATEDLDERIRTAKVYPKTGLQNLSSGFDRLLTRTEEDDTPSPTMLKIQKRVANAISGAKNIGQGAVEIPLSLGTGMLAQAPAAAAWLTAGFQPNARDKTESGKSKAREAYEDAQRRFTYQPRSEAGQEGMELIGKGLEAAKIPPYVPGVGPMVSGARMGARAVPTVAQDYMVRKGVPAMEDAMKRQGLIMEAVKQPGGNWTPQSLERMQTLFQRGDDPAHVAQVQKLARNYLNKHAGTDVDEAKGLRVGPEITYEQIMDRSLKGKPTGSLEPHQVPPGTPPGAMVWDFNPKPELQAYLRHAGDMAPNIPPNQLAKMSVPQLLQAVAKMDAHTGKKVAKTGDARQAAAQRLTGEHPPGDVVMEGDVGKWLRFTKGQDPEYVKQGLSVDTCFGDHCVASIGHGKPNIGYPGHVPVRDIVTGRNPLANTGPNVRDTTSYIDSVLKGKGDILSLRTPEGLPAATMETRQGMNVGVPRADVRQLITPRDYLRWQKTMQEAGVPIEQRLPQNPGGGENVPARGNLDAGQIMSITEMYPQHYEKLQEWLKNPPMEVGQHKGLENRAVSPRFAQLTADMLRQEELAKRMSVGKYSSTDLQRSGVRTKPIQSIDEVIASLGREPGTPHLYGPGGQNSLERSIALIRQLQNERVISKDAASSFQDALSDIYKASGK